jgi:predicted Zn-dependent peptidase
VEIGLAKLFRKLPNTVAPERKLEDPAKTPPVLTLIHKPGQIQSQVVLRLPSVKRTHPQYWKISLLMDIFGGSDSLLYTRLRDDLGIVYAAWFYQTYKWRAGMLVGYMGCKAISTSQAIRETVKIMTSLHEEVPKRDLEQKRLDSLNSFVFNVDSPSALVEVYGRYYMRGEPLDTLTRIQDAFIGVSKEELEILAGEVLNPKRLQVFIVADKTTKIKTEGGVEYTFEDEVKRLAKTLDLPFREMELR